MSTPIISVRSSQNTNFHVGTPGNQPAVFLDRDGVINTFFDGFINTPEKLDAKLIPSSIQAIAKLTRNSTAKVFLVTNQSGIDSHRLTEAQNQAIQERLEQRIEEAGGHLDAIYFSPNDGKKFHVPAGEVDGRKPGPGMFYRAAQDFGDQIDLADSFMVGDMTIDIAAARNASPSMTAILVKTGFGGRDHKWDVEPDRVEENLSSAVDFILSQVPGRINQPTANWGATAKLRPSGGKVLPGSQTSLHNG